MYDKLDIEKVNKADIRDFVPEVEGTRASLYRTCPECGAGGKNKGLCVTHKGALNLAKCFHCGFTLKSPVDAVMYFEQVKFPEAVKRVAERSGLVVETMEERERRTRSSEAGRVPFYLQQLYGSGLTERDVAIHVKDETTGQPVSLSPFRCGTILKNGKPGLGDDMLIHYYDLEGKPETYTTPQGEEAPYIRVRWRDPERHANIEGKAVRYQTPKGASCRLYIPQHVRALYNKGVTLETLFVTEGEKKAEKACKHGLHAVGIQGIFNIGNEQTGLLESLVRIIEQCKVRNVALLLDSDWNDLSEHLHMGDKIDRRPNLFSKAVIKFRDYLKTLHARGSSADVYFAYVKANERGDKGVDDLLIGTLAGRENLLAEDVAKTLDTRDGRGLYVNIHKITALSDFAIRDFWALNKHEDFFRFHRDDLKGITSFRIGEVAYNVKDDKLVPNVRCASDGEIWAVAFKENGKREVAFDYFEALNFISANGFHRVLTEWTNTGEYSFIHIEDGIVRHTFEATIRTFVFNYVQSATTDREVISMFIKSLGKLLSKDVLERLDISDEDYDHIEKYKQRFYFRNGQVTVTPKEITFGQIIDPVWEDRLIDRPFVRKPLFRFIERSGTGNFLLEITPEGERCEFLRFLRNTSNFWGRGELTPEQRVEQITHLVNKVTAIGFLLNDYKFQTELKALIAVDGKMSEVGQSNGRSGKSIVGVAISKMVAQAYIDGRNTSNDDQFMYSCVTPRTRNIFLDDAQRAFNYEKLFGSITGDLAVNPKNKDRFIIPNARSPKFYITTNHAIPTRSSSTADRIVFMIFSDWYNVNYSPYDDFGHQLFNDWDTEQWNLFDNLMLECNYFYQRAMQCAWGEPGRGAISPPLERIKLRNARQEMGEDFLALAETYFDATTYNLNKRIVRKTMQEDFQKTVPGTFRPVVFRGKLIAYCQFKGYHFNVFVRNKAGTTFADFHAAHPDEIFVGHMDKANSQEFFSVSQTAWAEQQNFMN